MSRIAKPTGKISKIAGKKSKSRGKNAPEPEPVSTTVTYLQMSAEPLLNVVPPARKIAILKAEKPPVHYSRYLYDTAGADYLWVDRKRMSDSELKNVVHDDNYDTWVLFCEGSPAGYFELDYRSMPDIKLAYFGLFGEYTGVGLGKYLLTQAIKTAWSHKPDRLLVETCTLDHPSALSLYQKCGFTPYAQKNSTVYPQE